MGFKLELPPIRAFSDVASLRNELVLQRELLIRLVAHINDLGCGLKFNDDNRLAINHNVESVVCCDDVGIQAVSFAGMVKGSHKSHSGMMVAGGVID